MQPPPPSSPSPPPLQVSLTEAGKMLGGDEPFSVRTIQRLIACGELIATGNGRLRRVDYQSILDKQARMRQGAPLWPERKRNAARGGKATASIRPARAGLALS